MDRSTHRQNSRYAEEHRTRHGDRRGEHENTHGRGYDRVGSMRDERETYRSGRGAQSYHRDDDDGGYSPRDTRRGFHGGRDSVDDEPRDRRRNENGRRPDEHRHSRPRFSNVWDDGSSNHHSRANGGQGASQNGQSEFETRGGRGGDGYTGGYEGYGNGNGRSQGRRGAVDMGCPDRG